MSQIFILFLIAGGTLSLEYEGKISSTVISKAEQNGLINITVSFSNSTSTLQEDAKLQFKSRKEQLTNLYETLTKEADHSQKGLIKMLKYKPLTNPNTKVRRFWITNQMVIRNADAALIKIISEDPQVSSIKEEEVVKLHNPIKSSFQGAKSNKMQWGIKKIQAPEAWDYLEGCNGNGVVVGILDTGVSRNHEALRDNYLGDYGWYDPYWNSEFPYDTHGHGSHVAGTILGSKGGIGVAPSARWSACIGCFGGSCAYADLLACGEFFTCPTLPDGSGRDCSKAPHIINNSWGGGRSGNSFNGMINTWRRAGIIPVFSVGNNGPYCNTAGSPGDNPNVISVGATTDRDAIADFSSLGPGINGIVKPDITAPGKDIISAGDLGFRQYVTLSGTSMAAPHVAGVIALMKSRNMELTFDDVSKILIENADKELSFKGINCRGTNDGVFPNNVFGNGRVNALKCVKAVGGEGRRRGDTKNIEFFTEKDHEGKMIQFAVKDTRDCHSITECWNDKASSVNTNGNCVMVYKHRECGGKSERIAPGTKWHADLERIGMDKMISSFRLC